jgi:hypothetical protein
VQLYFSQLFSFIRISIFLFLNLTGRIRLAYQTRLNENNLQLQHILLGIGEIIPLPLLSLLSPLELEWEVCGKPFIDINLLKVYIHSLSRFPS